MKKNATLIILLLTLILGLRASAQTIISGKVMFKKQTIAGASITLKDTYDGTTSDSLGNFKFTTTEKGNQLLLITAVNYKPFEQPLTLAGQPSTFEITMKEEVTELNAVIVSAGTFEAG